LTSFPAQANDEMLASYGVQRVFNATPPQVTDTQVMEEGAPVFADDRWNQTFTVRDMTAEELASRDEAKAAEIRMLRNAQLAASDWTQVTDAPVDKAAWATYRQALRDVTNQAGFPWTVDFPTIPK
jgi:hypothetical protein